jgi:hypothetical protein
MPRANALRWLAVALLLGLAAAAIVAGLDRDPGPAGWPGDENFGYRPDPQGVERFLAELPQPLFRDAGAETVREAKGVDTFLYRSAVRAHLARYGKPWVCERQGIGDCTSWGWAH